MNLRKLRTNDDRAVSPVIAVILMVAITVVLAATVYVWVSGFGSQSGSASKSIALSSDGAIDSAHTKTYTVSAATPGLKWSDLDFTLDGLALAYEADDAVDAAQEFTVVGETGDADGTTPSTTVDAGDRLRIRQASISGQTLRVLDSNANSVILTLVVG